MSAPHIRLLKAVLYLLALGGGAGVAELTARGVPQRASETPDDTGLRAQGAAVTAQPAPPDAAGARRAAGEEPRAGARAATDLESDRAPEPVIAAAAVQPADLELAAEPSLAAIVPEVEPADFERPAEPMLAALTAELSDAERATGGAYKDGMIVTGSTPHRLILFTFDDGPDPKTTPLLLDRLDEAGIKAVFFLVARRMVGATPIERRQIAVAREIVRRGHLVAGHTLDHLQLPLLDDDAVNHQLVASEDIFARVFGSRPFLLRPPFGAHSQRIDQLLAARGYTTVLWNLGTGDFQVRTAEDVYRTWLKVFERREREFGDRGGIILLHDTHAWSVDAFQMIVSHLLSRNCELLERGEELFDFVDDLAFFYVPRGDAPAEAEAPRIEIAPEVLAERQRMLRETTARRCKSLAVAY